MQENKRTFFECAEDYYWVFIQSYNAGLVENTMVTISLEACEGYIKHLISVFCLPRSEAEETEKRLILEYDVYSLKNLAGFLWEMSGLAFSRETSALMESLDEFCSDNWSSSKHALPLSRNDVKQCKVAVEQCRNETLDIIEKKWIAFWKLREVFPKSMVE